LTQAAQQIDFPKFKSRLNLEAFVPVVFRVRLGKTGKSLRITVPKPITDGYQWKEGDEIVLIVTDEEITMKRVSSPSESGDR
jgi:AbrB family looped-hinge helix DNA binding protein